MFFTCDLCSHFTATLRTCALLPVMWILLLDNINVVHWSVINNKKAPPKLRRIRRRCHQKGGGSTGKNLAQCSIRKQTHPVVRYWAAGGWAKRPADVPHFVQGVMACLLLAVPATSASSEGIHSTAGERCHPQAKTFGAWAGEKSLIFLHGCHRGGAEHD